MQSCRGKQGQACVPLLPNRIGLAVSLAIVRESGTGNRQCYWCAELLYLHHIIELADCLVLCLPQKGD